jgi:thiosulfate sulfurtransferase
MFSKINVAQAKQLFSEKSCCILDARDANSFNVQHIEGAEQVTLDTLPNLAKRFSLSTPIVVYCYKGVSSLTLAGLLSEAGFQEVYSLIGGFEAWKNESDNDGNR